MTNHLDLGLALLSIAREPGVELTLEDIAAWCGCPASTIQRIEQCALKKLFWSTQNPKVRRALIKAMRNIQKPPATPFKYRPQYGLIIVCKDEADQKKKFTQLTKRGLTVRVVTV